MYLYVSLLPNASSCAHGEAKQTKTSEFVAEKGLLQSQPRRTGGSCSKILNSDDFQGVFIGKVWGEGCMVYDFLLIGW